MSTQLQSSPASRAKQAYVLLKAVEQLQQISGGINSGYGAEQCNRLLTVARDLAADDPEILRSLDSLEPLTFEPGMGQWLVAEARVFLAELNGILRAYVNLHMEPQDKQRLGL
jgi:hypothetical protein